ncbi:MAG: P-loop NTPase fold protein [Thermodesulfobacteriota bacterium]
MVEIIIRNDEAATEDTLDRNKYAEVMAELATTCETPFVVGMYGGWGVGKTSLMDLIKKELNPEETRVVWFESWQHQHDENIALSLLHTMVDQLELGKEAKKLLMVVAGSLGSILLKATTNISADEINEIGKRYEEERFQAREAQMRMRDHFRDLIKKAQGKGKKKKRIVFFIDDLDRCSPKSSFALLESLKLYLNIPECVYFVGADRPALEKSIAHHYKDREMDEADYMDKIVQLPFNIPPIAPDSIRGFIKPLLSGELKGCLEILVMGLDDNPRQAKRFVNTLTLNHLLAGKFKEPIPNYDPCVLALLIMIQEWDMGLYRVLSREPERLIRLKKGSDEEEKYLKDIPAPVVEKLKEILSIVELTDVYILKRYIHLTEEVGLSEKETTIKDPGKLKVILAKHREWLDTIGESGRCADLSGMDLRSFNLSRANLRNANLNKANLSGVNLKDTDLRYVDLTSANLREAEMIGANLANAQLSNADLTGATLITAKLRGVKLNKANLSFVYLSESDLRESILNGANLINADLRGADLSGANLNGANLSGADLNKADLNKADLSGVDFTRSFGLTREQIESAIIDETTKLPWDK